MTIIYSHNVLLHVILTGDSAGSSCTNDKDECSFTFHYNSLIKTDAIFIYKIIIKKCF